MYTIVSHFFLLYMHFVRWNPVTIYWYLIWWMEGYHPWSTSWMIWPVFLTVDIVIIPINKIKDFLLNKFHIYGLYAEYIIL